MKKIYESNPKCPECKKGYLNFNGILKTEKPYNLFKELLPFYKNKTVAYEVECNNCGTIFERKYPEKKNEML